MLSFSLRKLLETFQNQLYTIDNSNNCELPRKVTIMMEHQQEVPSVVINTMEPNSDDRIISVITRTTRAINNRRRLTSNHKMQFESAMIGKRSQLAVSALVMFAIMMLAIIAKPSEAGEQLAAISEVWSEGDGLHLKYSTNHDDLLGSKSGSELSLGTDQNNQRVEANGGETQGANQEEQSSSGSTEESAAPTSPGGESDGHQEASSGGSGSGGNDNDEHQHQQQQQQQSGSSESANEGEQGADSKRNTEKIPIGGRVASYSSALDGGSKRPSNQFDLNKSVAANSNNNNDNQIDEADDAFPSQRASVGGKKSSPDSFSFSSTLNQIESPAASSDPGAAGSLNENNNNSNNNNNNNDNDNDNNDVSPDESDESRGAAFNGAASSALNNKFHQPGRLFKQAVRLNGAPAARSKSETRDESADEDSRVENHSDQVQGRDPAARKHGRGGGAQSDSDDDKAANGETMDEDPPGTGSKALSETTDDGDQKVARGEIDLFEAAKRNNNNARPGISYDGGEQYTSFRSQHPSESASLDGSDDQAEIGFGNGMLHLDGPVAEAAARNAFHGPELVAANHVDFEGPTNFFGPQFGGPITFHDQQRPAALAAATHKERVVGAGKLASATGASNKQQLSGGAGKPSNQNYKQLAYFKGVNEQQRQQKQANGDSRQAQPSKGHQATRGQQVSPDSVRDDFISPGHYPGSMPHLNSAASETVAAKNLVAAPKSTGDELLTQSASSTSQHLVVSDIKQHDGASKLSDNSANNKPSSAQTGPTQAAIGLANQLMVAMVTPVPETQPESQQIMAPILMSTTTMAPMLSQASIAATTAPATVASVSPPTTATPLSQSSTTTTTTTPATSQAPSLKRFKFRKYR